MKPRVTRNEAGRSVSMSEAVSRKTLGWGDHTLLSEVTLGKGGIVPIHSHPHEQIGYVAKGIVEFTIDGEVHVVRAGDGYVIPGNVSHGCRALEDSIALDIFSPVREEYKD